MLLGEGLLKPELSGRTPGFNVGNLGREGEKEKGWKWGVGRCGKKVKFLEYFSECCKWSHVERSDSVSIYCNH